MFTAEEQYIISQFIANALQTQDPQVITSMFFAIIKNDQETLATIRDNVKAYVQGLIAENTAQLSGLDAKHQAEQEFLDARSVLLTALNEKL